MFLDVEMGLRTRLVALRVEWIIPACHQHRSESRFWSYLIFLGGDMSSVGFASILHETCPKTHLHVQEHVLGSITMFPLLKLKIAQKNRGTRIQGELRFMCHRFLGRESK